jgi:hypothetical protein
MKISQNHHIPWWWKNLNIIIYLNNWIFKERILIFDDIKHINNCTSIHQYVYFWQGVIKLIKFIIQRLLRLYNRDIYSDLTKTKALLMASIGNGAFNIDGLTMHLTLNIHVQKSLLSLLNLSSNSLNMFTCQYEQL